jgi:uncharacterized protein with GYD domain
MATYIILVSYTQKGVENIKESPTRLDTAKKVFQSMGAELKKFYLVMGQYDIVVVAEAPNDETAAKVALLLVRRAPSAQRHLGPLQRMSTERLSLHFPNSVILSTLFKSSSTPPLKINIYKGIFMVPILSLSCNNRVCNKTLKGVR